MSFEFFHKGGPLPLNEETADTLIQAVEKRRLVALSKKHPLSPEHLLLKNGRGTSALLMAVVGGHLDEVAAALTPSGQYLTVDHFSTWDVGRSLIHTAAECGHLDQVQAALKRGGESLKLEHLLWKDGLGYNSLHHAAQSGSLDQVAEILSASGETLKSEHLSIPATLNHCTPLQEAFAHGYLDQASDVLKFFGEKFTHEQFLQKDCQGWNLVQIAIGNDCLASLFKPSYWARNVGEMAQLWQAIPEGKKFQIDYPALRAQAIEQSLQKFSADDFKNAARASAAVNRKEPAVILSRGGM